jgi:hydrogenase expression/formation protein HypC
MAGKVELAGTVREIGLGLIDSPRLGEYVLVHAGFAIQRIDEEEALKTLEVFRELFEAMAEETAGET